MERSVSPSVFEFPASLPPSPLTPERVHPRRFTISFTTSPSTSDALSRPSSPPPLPRDLSPFPPTRLLPRLLLSRTVPYTSNTAPTHCAVTVTRRHHFLVAIIDHFANSSKPRAKGTSTASPVLRRHVKREKRERIADRCLGRIAFRRLTFFRNEKDPHSDQPRQPLYRGALRELSLFFLASGLELRRGRGEKEVMKGRVKRRLDRRWRRGVVKLRSEGRGVCLVPSC